MLSFQIKFSETRRGPLLSNNAKVEFQKPTSLHLLGPSVVQNFADFPVQLVVNFQQCHHHKRNKF